MFIFLTLQHVLKQSLTVQALLLFDIICTEQEHYHVLFVVIEKVFIIFKNNSMKKNENKCLT